MEITTYNGLSHTLTTVIIASLVFPAYFLFLKAKERFHLAKLPVLRYSRNSEQHRLAYMQSALKMYSDGYKQVSD